MSNIKTQKRPDVPVDVNQGIDELKRDVSDNATQTQHQWKFINFQWTVMLAIIVTLFIAVVGWIVSAIHSNTNSYKEYTKVLTEYQRVESLRLKSDRLETYINDLEQRLLMVERKNK